jgi:hypothetical protein
MFTDDKVTEIYCLVDDFCKLFNDQMKKYMISDDNKPRKRKKVYGHNYRGHHPVESVP